MAHVAEWKKETVNTLQGIMITHPVVALVDIGGIPAPQMQSMRKRLRERAELKVARNKLIDIAIDRAAEERPGLESLKDSLDGQSAILATTMNPFKLYKEIEGTKSPAPAKPGDISPKDIKVTKGETPFPPGPIVGELQKAGVPAAIEGGKIVIKKNKVLVKEGEEISEEVAKVLPRLDIYPMIVGLGLKAAYEDGVIYDKDTLDIPPDYYESRLARGADSAIRLGLAVSYPTPETVPLLLSKAHQEATGLSVAAAIPNESSIRTLLARAESHMLSLASSVPELEDERIAGKMKQQPTSPEADKEEVSEEEEEVSEEEASAGLSSLFG